MHFGSFYLLVAVKSFILKQEVLCDIYLVLYVSGFLTLFFDKHLKEVARIYIYVILWTFWITPLSLFDW